MSTWCLVTLPNSTVERIKVDLKENARECLEKVCRHLDTLETDYFGLQYIPAKGCCAGQPQWLNLRNPIGQQVQGPPPYQLQLRVKFYVSPHHLQQESTREQVYLQIRQDLLTGRIHVADCNQAAILGALIAQAELGDAKALDTDLRPLHYPVFLPEVDCAVSSMVHKEHLRLAGVGSQLAKYHLIEEVMALISYGVEYYEVRHAGHQFDVGIGPAGMSLFEHGSWNCVEQIEHSAITRVSQNKKMLQLDLLDDTGSSRCLQLRLASEPTTQGLYRCLTEMISFYCCDTVRNDVSVQFSRDLKGTIISLFNENTTLGKKFVFDIQRTLREAHDHARRCLYKLQTSTAQLEPPVCSCGSSESSEGAGELCATCLAPREHHMELEVDLCCCCMDQERDCRFSPCNHTQCCSSCAQRLDRCPVCRSDIEHTQVIYPS